MAICLETIDSSHSLLICWREREKGRLNELIDLEKVWGSLAQKILPKTKTSAHVLHLVWKPSFNFSLNSFQNSCSARHLCFLTIIKYALKAHYILGTVVGKRKHGLNFSTLMKFNKFLFPPKLFLEALPALNVPIICCVIFLLDHILLQSSIDFSALLHRSSLSTRALSYFYLFSIQACVWQGQWVYF